MSLPRSSLLSVPLPGFLAAGLLAAFSLVLTSCGGAASGSPPPTPGTYMLTVTPPPKGAGAVVSVPPGIDCPPTCSASFPQNSQVKLSANAGSSYYFGGWDGSCSGTAACNLLMDSAENVKAIFTPARGGTGVLAYVFTPDAVNANSAEFALLANGQLRSTGRTVQPLLMTGTNYGLVTALQTGQSNTSLQSYAVKGDGSLHAKGNPANVAVDKSITLASDQTYVYAVTDEGLVAFADTNNGLNAMQAIDETVPAPVACTIAQENANECQLLGILRLSNSSAFLLQSYAGQTGSPVNQMTSFSRSQGELSGEEYFAGDVLTTGVFAPTPDGKFVYALDLASNRVFRYESGGNGMYETNILSNGEQLQDGFIQLLISADGKFLFAPVSDSAESPRIRVFSIDAPTGDLREVSGSPFSTGEYYLVAVGLDPTGQFLLALHSYCDASPPCLSPGKLVAMKLNSSSGRLSVTTDVVDGQNPYAIIAVPVSQ